MGLTLDFPPGYSDLADSAIAAGSPALGLDILKIYGNAAFGEARLEVFQGLYVDGDSVPVPTSPIDGYVYSRAELIYMWVPWNSSDAKTGWLSGKDSLWYGAWLVDQATGNVSSDENYLAYSHSESDTKDGQLLVFTIAQRQKNDLVIAVGSPAGSPAWVPITAGWIGANEPLTEQLIQALNVDAKLSVVKTEVFYLGEFYNGQTVSTPVSPADGYAYSYAECQFQFSWRWTPAGNITPLKQPSNQLQLGPFAASVSSVGLVSTNVDYIGGGGEVVSSYSNDGRIAVFAFCTRSGRPGSISPAAANFTQLDYNTLLPGNPLEYPALDTILADIEQAMLTPEFFGPTTYTNGDTIPLPTSPVDGYAYARNELSYLWTWSIVSPGPYPPGLTDHDRIAMFYGSINQSTGVVSLDVWRLAPGGPYIDAGGSNCKISVVIVARRQAEPVSGPGTNPGTNPQSNSGSVSTDATVTLQVDDLSSSCNGSNTAFTASLAPRPMAFMVWNGQLRFDFTAVGTAITTSFTPDTGDTLYAFYFR